MVRGSLWLHIFKLIVSVFKIIIRYMLEQKIQICIHIVV